MGKDSGCEQMPDPDQGGEDQRLGVERFSQGCRFDKKLTPKNSPWRQFGSRGIDGVGIPAHAAGGQRREEAYQSAKIALLQRVLGEASGAWGGWLGAAPVKTSALLHARFCMTSQAFILHASFNFAYLHIRMYHTVFVHPEVRTLL